MFERLAYLRKRLFTGTWFIPIALCTASFLLGVLMLGLDRHMTSLFSGLCMFALPVDSARQVLGVIAGSVISVGGVSFSVTMVARTLTSGQYGPKVLWHFLEDNDSKVSLGLFLGVCVYVSARATSSSAASARSSLWLPPRRPRRVDRGA